MGLLSGISRALFGGSKQRSVAQQTSSSGFGAMPSDFQGYYRDAFNAVRNLPTDTWRPPELNTYEQQFYDQSGAPARTFDPNALQTRIAALMNPMRDYVFNDINNAASSENARVASAAARYGRGGSDNATMLMGDIAKKRDEAIGNVSSNFFGDALSKALGTFSEEDALKKQKLADLGTAGDSMRALDTADKQAPIAQAQTLAQLLAPMFGASYSQGTNTSSGESSKGLGGLFAAILGK